MVPQRLLQPFWAMARAWEETGTAVRPAEERRKGNAMRVDAAVEVEDSPTSCSSSSRRRSRNSLSLSSSRGRSNSSSTQYSSNCRNNSDMVAGVEHSSTGAPHHIICIRVICECVIDVEGRGISTRNAGKLFHLPLTDLLFQVHTSRNTAIFLPLHYLTCKMDHLIRASGHLHHLSQYRCLHRYRLYHHSHHISRYPTSSCKPSVPPSNLTGVFHPGPLWRNSRLQANIRVYI